MSGNDGFLGPVALLILISLPGAWLAFGLRLPRVSLAGRLALGVVLSPLVVSAQAFLLRWAGLGWAPITAVLCGVNLLAGILVVRAALREADWPEPKAWLPAGLLMLLLGGCLVVPWLRWPEVRDLAYHGLMHTDYIYALTRSAMSPEAATLAGVPLIYFWFGHLFLTASAWAADWAPTRIYLLLNLVWLAAGAAMAYEMCRSLGLRRATALLSVGLLFLATNLIGLTALAGLEERRHSVFHLLGRPTHAPFLMKYLHLSMMPLGQSLLIAMAWFALTALRAKHLATSILLGVLLLALGLLYTPLFPVGCVWGGALIVLLLLPDVPGVARYERRDLLLLIGGFVVAGLATVWAVQVFTVARSGSLLGLSDPVLMLKKTLWMGFAFAPMLVLAWPSLRRALLFRDGAQTLLAAGSLAAIAMYIVIRMDPPSEYKFIFGGAVGLAPLIGASLDPVFARRPKLAGWTALAVPALLAGIFLAGTPSRLPKTYPDLPRVTTDSFWISLAEGEPAAKWTRAVRESTPTDTVLVLRDATLHLSAFTARAAFLARTPDPHGQTPGFNQGYLRHFAFLGYPSEVVEQRTELLESLYGGMDPRVFAQGLSELQRLKRPLAIHFSNDSSAFLAWLRERRIGKELIRDGDELVWFVSEREGERT
jgi:hypothetical protein